MKKPGFLITLLMLLTLTGCARLGGPTIIRDRFDYSVAVSESWKSQMLLNIVKIRYSDTPVFMDVTSVINLVGIQNTVSLAAGWSFPPNANTQAIVEHLPGEKNRRSPMPHSPEKNSPGVS